MLGSAALTSGLTVGGLLAKDMLGSATFAGAANASLTLGTALASAHLSVRMNRLGRRPGLLRGYHIALAGAIVAIAAAQIEFFPLFIAGLVLFGHGQASTLLSRYAAADLAHESDRAKAISTMVFASTFGAVSGPLLIGVGKWVGRLLGIREKAGPFALSVALFALAAANTAIRLRPDPLVVAGGIRPQGAPRERVQLRASLAVIRASQMPSLALATMVISQVVMVAVMTMTPLHMDAHGHSDQLIGTVIACHIAGMYAFAPVVGWLNARYERLPVIGAGAAILIAATVVSALAGHRPGLLFAGLFLLGLGWSFGLVTGSALLTESVPAEAKVKVQGAADLCMSLCGGAAGFASGFVRRAFGFHMLSNAGTLLAGLLIVAVVGLAGSARRRATGLAHGG